MQKIDRTRRKRRYLALSFAVPFGVMLLCFILGGLWPFGDRQVLAHDMWHQYYPFFVSFREKLRSGGSLQYLREAGMGIGYLPLRADIVDDPAYLKAFADENPLIRTNLAQLKNIKPSTIWPGDSATELSQIFVDAIAQAVTTDADVRETLEAAQEQINGMIG